MAIENILDIGIWEITYDLSLDMREIIYGSN
jgi:hypothetical protein